ncbi:hypothetical protein AV540_01975 [Brevibacillus parabrevis]|uniref:ABC transporter permease n=1 Tax=Brevibacillus parabrevis TaxID=54914 RepID=UPI0007AB7176|nr:ABC transporter permease [Brevibacillus parabrevis]KZE44091.1 hypothetical protein AV540_01975 [Brevibacillus parabrevis]
MPTFVILREWKELFANRSVLITNLAAPFVILIMALITTVFAQNGKMEFVLTLMKLTNPLLNMAGDDGQIAIARFYFLLFLIVPAMIPLTFATTSIITEKITGTLESVLVTPISTKEFLLGKILAFALPSVALTWIIQLIFLGFIFASFDNASTHFSIVFILAMILLVPFVSIISLSLSVVVSSKVDNVAAAQQFGALLVLPIIGLAISQVIFLSMMSNPLIYLGLVTGCAVLALITFQISVKLFDREHIISKWK